MKVIIFGATGMVGQGALKACLADPSVSDVLVIGRSSLGETHSKLKEILHKNFTDFSAIEKELTGYDACFFCLGISSAGMSEKDYRHITYDMGLAAAKTLSKLNPTMSFVYVSGASTDSTEKGKVMWARVKGETENAILKLPFKAAYMFRSGGIEPMDGIQPKTKWIRVLYWVMSPLIPWLRRKYPKYITDTRQLGKAMIHVCQSGSPSRIIENEEINQL